jgi:hypothetical protein
MQSLNEWLFNPPVFVPIAAIVVGVLVLAFGFIGGGKPLRIGGLIVAVLATLWFFGARWVETWVEVAEAETRDLVVAYDEENWTRFGEIILPNTRFANLMVGDTITAAAEATRPRVGQASVSVDSISSESDAAGIRVKVRVDSTGTNNSMPKTLWQFDYVVRSDRLELDQIEPLDTPFLNVESILNRVVIPR